jgi:tryptophanyl-tRNA synthetase
MVIENIRYFQEQGAITYCVIADLESASTRGVTLQEAQKRALEFHIPAYIALGLDPKKTRFYFQSENKEVVKLAYEFAKKVTLNEFRAIYGSADPGRIMAAITQVGDIVYPQLEEGMPGIVPSGVDQDPHLRLTRDVVKRVRSKYKFFAPSSMYHKYTQSLDGSLKMSKSKPESNIDLPEDEKSFCKKIMRSHSGGKDTLEEHRKKGGNVEEDMAFQMLRTHLLEDDKKLEKIEKDYTSGKLTSGEMKQLACEHMTKFMKDFNKNLEKARKMVPKLNFVKF